MVPLRTVALAAALLAPSGVDLGAAPANPANPARGARKAAAAAALDPDVPVLPLTGPAWHPIDTWRQPQGLPQNTIITLLQTRDGYMWIGTKGGVARFDGVHFTTFEKRAVSETEVWELDEGADVSLWIATYGAGLHRLKNSQLVAGYSTKDGLASNFVMAVCEDDAGDVWAGTDKGVSRLNSKDGTFTTFTKKDGLQESTVNTLLCEAGQVWIGTSGGGLHIFKDGKISANQLPEPHPGSVSNVVRTKDGALWVGSGSTVLRLQNDTWTRFTEADGLGDMRGIRMHAARQGGLWVGASSGVYSWDGSRFERHDIVPDRTQKQTITALCLDHEGSLWVGHSALVLARLRQGYFATYGTTHGIVGAGIRTVFEDREGTVYVGTSDGLNRIREGRFQLVTDKKGEPVSPISSLTQDTRGRIWFGTPTAVYRYEPGNTCPGKPVCAEDIVQQDKGAIDRMNTRVVFADSRGDVWVGTDQQGLARYHDDTVTTYTTKDGLCDNGIRGITEAADGTIWIGTKERGACLYKDGKFTPITEKDGLASDLIQGVYRGRDDSIWLQTRRGLTRRMPDGRFVTYTVAEGLYADHLYGLAEDLQGNMWMGCSRGVFRVSVKDLDAFAQGNTKRVTSIAYGIEDGLKSTVLSSGFTPSLIRSRDGRVWLATTDGMSVVDPTILKTNSIPPPVHLESVDINGASFDYTKPAQAAPGNGDLTFRYTGLSFIDPQKVHFKVRLEPYDRDWVDAQNMRLKQYTNIPPGRYHFLVKAANTDGVWNETGARFDIYLAPHLSLIHI